MAGVGGGKQTPNIWLWRILYMSTKWYHNIFFQITSRYTPWGRIQEQTWRHPPIPHTQHSIKPSCATGCLSLPRSISTAQSQTALGFCKVGWCPFYKNTNLQYITLHHFNLHRFPLPQVTHISFYKLGKKKVMLPLVIYIWEIVNSVNQNLEQWVESAIYIISTKE